jgi:hypothetical protein
MTASLVVDSDALKPNMSEQLREVKSTSIQLSPDVRDRDPDIPAVRRLENAPGKLHQAATNITDHAYSRFKLMFGRGSHDSRPVAFGNNPTRGIQSSRRILQEYQMVLGDICPMVALAARSASHRCSMSTLRETASC